ncbi:hypothetical protein RHSIM_Rhsim12G0191700 [Rhododendron simsii]|uniref:Trichome birefringence-like N-terminal domain-containing protein n=1 Tax=Rhododendron simsii TaxID=118357 RepID=A0A834G3L9_RHOSS|nr:hypothetical protein RHSIM_Rhsim12G0191700 [Rhododendron simsii]
MGLTNPSEEQPQCLSKKLISFTFCSLLSIALIQFHFSATPFSFSSTEQLLRNKPVAVSTTITTTTSSSSSSSSSKEEERAKVQIACDYNNGKWIPDKLGPIYNGTNCGIVTNYQDCMTNGRPDLVYLHWKWKPNQCNIPSYNTGDKKIHDKFRRWHFPSHNLNVSIYWSPFLVRGIERRRFKDYCRLYLDSLDEQWAPDLDQMDMIVISFGHWLPQPSLYFFGDSAQGCHKCTGLNYTEAGIYGVFQKIIKTTIDKVIDGRGGGDGKGIDVIVTTFSPHHFEGEWDKFGACSRTQPFKEGEKRLEGMEVEMRRIAVAEVEAAKMKAKEFRKRIRLGVLDVTKLSLMRGDGHPGPYRVANPFANGVKERVKNDCTHWCVLGLVDTWNEILLDIINRWENNGF